MNTIKGLAVIIALCTGSILSCAYVIYGLYIRNDSTLDINDVILPCTVPCGLRYAMRQPEKPMTGFTGETGTLVYLEDRAA